MVQAAKYANYPVTVCMAPMNTDGLILVHKAGLLLSVSAVPFDAGICLTKALSEVCLPHVFSIGKCLHDPPLAVETLACRSSPGEDPWC